ncbi:hypothetical protein GU926_02840 [Nibribacter ruber]|uniref:Uncharacterized protein n=1 Tax=Nibribacter ruber TaxID=2698458 RepID=A0A6P1NVS6_9BACT|nr:hypothetical protein [Nibribacter ruber]QHL86434.1 hypothetical protein GU926_02840 [Nibribacter ruber]
MLKNLSWRKVIMVLELVAILLCTVDYFLKEKIVEEKEIHLNGITASKPRYSDYNSSLVTAIVVNERKIFLKDSDMSKIWIDGQVKIFQTPMLGIIKDVHYKDRDTKLTVKTSPSFSVYKPYFIWLFLFFTLCIYALFTKNEKGQTHGFIISLLIFSAILVFEIL